jgi:protein MBA1
VQKLTRFKPGGGGVVEGSGRERQTVEYLVIQKKLERGVEGEWMVWGTTEEMTLSKLRAEETEDLPEGGEQYIKKS